MIQNPDIQQCCNDSRIAAHIKSEFSELCGDGMLVDSSNLDEVAKAVECFLEQDSECSFVNSGDLVMLTSRALQSVGESNAARRFLLFGSGLVKPSEWEVVDGGEMWVLDLKQITVRDDSAGLELLFFAALNMLMEGIADIWDVTSGEGQLGLRNVCTAATSVLGNRSVKRVQNSMMDEIRLACSDKLRLIGGQRGWISSPGVMNLDIC